MTMKWTPSSVPVSYTETRLVWFRRAADWASRRNRATKFASPAYWGERTFTATGRPRTVSVPLNTVAMPPRPSSDSTRYRPPRSICAVTWSFVRSLMQCSLHDGLGDGSGHHAARRVAAKATAVEDDDGDRDLGVLVGSEGLDHLPARVPDLRHQAWPHLRPTVGDRRSNQGHLHGIGRHVVLSDGRERDGGQPVGEVRRVGEHAFLERDVERDIPARGVRCEPEGVGLCGKLGRADLQADLTEHHVARDGQGLGQGEL